jgi:hypothetical protein
VVGWLSGWEKKREKSFMTHLRKGYTGCLRLKEWGSSLLMHI